MAEKNPTNKPGIGTPGQAPNVAPAVAPKPNFFKKLRQPLIAIVIIVVVVGAGLLIDKEVRDHSGSHSGTAFVIDGKNYSKKQITAMVTFATQDSNKSAAHRRIVAKNIYNLYLTQVAAQKANIIPTKAEEQAAIHDASVTSSGSSVANAYVNLLAFNNALPTAYARYQSADDDGYSFVFNFSQKILPTTPGKPAAPGHGNQKLINQDKKYASQQADKYYTELKSKKITPDRLLAAIAANSRLNFSSPSTHFSASGRGSLQTQIYYTDIYNYVAVQSKPGLSSVRTGKVPDRWGQPSKDYVPGYYYFVLMNKASPIITNPAANVVAQKAKLQAVYYGI